METVEFQISLTVTGKHDPKTGNIQDAKISIATGASANFMDEVYTPEDDGGLRSVNQSGHELIRSVLLDSLISNIAEAQPKKGQNKRNAVRKVLSEVLTSIDRRVRAITRKRNGKIILLNEDNDIILP